MRFFRKIADFLFHKDVDAHEHDSRDNADAEHDGQHRPTQFRVRETGLPRRGFSVPAQVVVDRPQPGPVLTPSTSSNGGIQGLRWYGKRLRIDEDGNVADTFLDEVSSEAPTLAADHHKTATRFKPKHDVMPVQVKTQFLSAPEGKIHHHVEHQGKLQWV